MARSFCVCAQCGGEWWEGEPEKHGARCPVTEHQRMVAEIAHLHQRVAALEARSK